MYGAVGFPLRVTRTVVVGKDSKVVSQVLNILSYFIRCTEVFEHVQKRDDGSKDDMKENVSCFGQESVQTICSQCGNKSLSEVENSGKTFAKEPSICLQCKQNCEGKCALHDELKDKEKKESLREQLLTQLQVTNGLAHCSHCSARINGSSLEKVPGVEILQSHCTCNKISNGGVRKELKHFMKDANLLALANNHCSSFQCYCCKEVTDVGGVVSKGTKFKCYCGSGCDSEKHQVKQDCIVHCCAKCFEKLQSSLNCKGNNLSEMNNCLASKILQPVQRQDSLSDSNEHVCNRISETDSCVSDDTDSLSMRNSVLEKCADVEETIASYGRSGSADSGIHQSPLNSPLTQRPGSFPTIVSHQLEDEQTPEELPLPR